MKPTLLKIKGLNSFEEEQTIDFEVLTSQGLFGIFGPTGSGKTSIIDAITLALYGEVSRYDKDSKNKRFINLNTETCTVIFEFEINIASKVEKYRVERVYKKNNDTQKVVRARFSIESESESQVLADKPTQVTSLIEEVIGLSYKDFSKTVVLPQGKFSDFLLLANIERRNMLERIFQLEKYGENLSSAISKEHNHKNQDLKVLQANLNMYGDISLDTIKENEEKLKFLTLESEKLKLKQKEISEKGISLKNTSNLYSQFKSYKDELNKIKLQENEIEETKIFLTNAKNVKLIMPTYNESLQEEIKKQENEKLLKHNQEVYNKLFSKEERLSQEVATLSALKKEKMPLLTEREYKLKQAKELLKEIEPLKEEKVKLVQKYKKSKNELNEYMVKSKSLEEGIQNSKNTLKNMSQRKKEIQLPTTYKSLVAKTFAEEVKLNEQQNKMEKHISKQNIHLNQINKYKKELEKVSSEINIYEKRIFEMYNHIKNKKISLNTQIKNIENTLENEKSKLKALEESIKDIQKNNFLFEISQDLKPENPCPLCGSSNHPVPLAKPKSHNLDNLSKKQQLLKQSIENKVNEIGIVNKSYMEVCALETLIQGSDINLDKVNFEKGSTNEDALIEEIANLKILLENSIKGFRQMGTNKEVLIAKLEKEEENFKVIKNEIEAINADMDINKKSLQDAYKELKTNNIAQLNENIKLYDEELIEIAKNEEEENSKINDITVNLQSVNNKVQEIKNDMTKVEIIGKEKAELINKHEQGIFKLSEGMEVDKYLEETQAEISKLNYDEEKVIQIHEEVKKELHKGSELKIELETKKITIDDKVYECQEKISNWLKEYKFKSIHEVLKYNISEEEQVRKEEETKKFDISKNDITNNLERLAKEIKNINGTNVEEIDIISINALVKVNNEEGELINHKISSCIEEIGVIKRNIIKINKDLSTVKKLKEEENGLIKHIDILLDLGKLFEGKRFVEFVSKKQLEYIAKDASVRLKDMSKGRYALELDDTDFIIRDDHYGGVRRPVKTLSGGETFMASLCLALALSSKIQLKNKSTLDFFFLDEGFGTLDLEALDIVMESLIKLQSQKIKVGVISHVEEMKTRIPNKLIVTPSNQGLHGTLVELE